MAVTDDTNDASGLRLPLQVIEKRARNGHGRPFAILPKTKDTSHGFVEVSYGALDNAINRVAWWLEQMTGGPKPGTVFSWSGPSDLRYPIFILAAMKCNYQALVPSPRNPDDYQRTLFAQAGCHLAFGTKATILKLKASLGDMPVRFVEGPTLEQMLDPEPVEVYPYDVTLEEVKRQTPLILHTSGSTGPPKPIRTPIDSIMSIARCRLLPVPRERQWWSVVEHKRLFVGFPPFHAAGTIGTIILPIYYDLSVVWAPSDRPLNHTIAEATMRQTKAQCAMLPPSVVEDLAKSTSGMEALAGLDSISYGGGPLNQALGDKVAKLTRLCNIYGSTEALMMPQMLAEREDWNYIELDPRMGYIFEHAQDDLYKLIIRRVPEQPDLHSVFLLMPHLNEFATGDMCSPHPTKPNLWCIKGRVDDLVILSSGEKFNPVPGEKVIDKSPLVKHCLLIGHGRPQALLLVERNAETTKDMSNEELSEKLWPVVEEMNRSMATQAHITPENLVIAPPGKHFSTTPKGSVRRKATEEMFEEELNGALEKQDVNNHANHEQASDNTTRQFKPGDEETAVREVVYSVCRTTEIGDDDDLFEYGLDSIQAQQISGALKKISKVWPEDKTAGTSIVYAKPTIRGLIEAVCPEVKEENGPDGDVSDALIKKYTSDLPNPPPISRPGAGMTVAITGSTGNLGCNMLNRLIEDPGVSKIVCLNRAVGGKEAQDAAFSRNRLTQAPLGDKAISYHKIDLSQPFLGLTAIEYSTIQREVDVLIHNAWQLDFLRPVKSFEKTHIAGVRHLIDLSAGSQRAMRIVFISSIGAVGGTSPDVFKAVPEEVAGPGIASGGNGYSESKLISEKILEQAAAKSGVKASIVRVGQVAGPGGDSQGTWSTTDWFPRIVMSAKVLRSLPENLGMTSTVDWVPINTVSEVLMDIVNGTQSDSFPKLNVFHIVNPQGIHWKELAPGVARYLGEDVRIVSFGSWIEELRVAIKEKEPGSIPVEALLPWLEGMNQGVEMAGLSVEKTKALSTALASVGPIQLSWLERWMADWGL